jgi:hypothetical protein
MKFHHGGLVERAIIMAETPPLCCRTHKHTPGILDIIVTGRGTSGVVCRGATTIS